MPLLAGLLAGPCAWYMLALSYVKFFGMCSYSPWCMPAVHVCICRFQAPVQQMTVQELYEVVHNPALVSDNIAVADLSSTAVGLSCTLQSLTVSGSVDHGCVAAGATMHGQQSVLHDFHKLQSGHAPWRFVVSTRTGQAVRASPCMYDALLSCRRRTASLWMYVNSGSTTQQGMVACTLPSHTGIYVQSTRPVESRTKQGCSQEHSRLRLLLVLHVMHMCMYTCQSRACRLPHFQLFPLSRMEEWGSTLSQQLDPEKETIVLCHHGVRSMQMAQVCMQTREGLRLDLPTYLARLQLDTSEIGEPLCAAACSHACCSKK